MKKIISSLLICSALLASYVPVTADNGAWKEFYVATNGSDQNPGTKDAPFATVHAAQEAVKAVNKDMQGDIIVNIEEGYYFLDKTLDLRQEDSGFNGHRVIWRGAGEDKSVLSGGRRVTGFEKSHIDGVYVADYDADLVLQMSVDGVAAYIAKSNDYVKGVTKPAELDTEDWFLANPKAPQGDHYNYYNPDTKYQYDGFYMSKQDIDFYENAQDMIFRWDCMFYSTTVRVDAIEECAEDSSMVKVIMEEGIWNAFLQPQQNSLPRPNREFHMMNALELLDAPGEFYYDRHAKKLYYMPREGEDMSSSVIVAANLKQVMIVEGYDTDKKVENVTFDGITFSDSRLDYFTNPMHESQAHVRSGARGESSGGFIQPAIYVDKANNFEFVNNVVRNTGGVGLLLYNGVTNATVVGNVFHDTGDTALAVGAANQSDYNLDFDSPDSDGPLGYGQSQFTRDRFSDPVPEEHKNDPIDISFDMGEAVLASYQDDDNSSADGRVNPSLGLKGSYASGPDDHITRVGGNYNSPKALNEVWVTEKDYKLYDYYWMDDVSAAKGEKAWVRYEFMRPWSIDEVVLSFNDACVKNGGNTDYEILVSNDRTFKEGTYKVLATQNGAAPEAINHYKYDDDTKYQYLMIRKTTPGTLALSKLWILSTDQKPWQKRERCAYLTIENNYITRAGYALEHGNGMCITDVDNTTIIHNRVENVGYTGIATGYEWGLSKTGSWDNEIAYNYIYNTNQNNLDGGGYYNLGPQIGSSLHHNFISRTNQSINALYTDNGSSYFDIHHNWMQSGRYALSPYTTNVTGIAYNKFYDNFGTYTLTQNTAAADQLIWNEPIQSIIGQPTSESYDTVANAGLEPEFAHIMDIVPKDVRIFSYHHYDHNNASYFNENSGSRPQRISNTNQELDVVLEEGKFGEGLGMYPEEVRAEVQAMRNYMDDENQADWAKRFTLVEEFIASLATKMNRYTYAETLKMCEDIILAYEEDDTLYPADAIATFKATVEKVKSSNGMSEYAALTTLEDAYNTIYKTMSSNNIANVIVPGADDVIIDEEAKTVTVHMPLGASFVIEDLSVVAEGGAKIARTLKGDIDISKELNIPVYNPGKNEYVTWTLKAINTPAAGGGITGDVWTTNTDETGFVRGGENGSVTLCAMDYAFMSKVTGGDEKTSLTIKPSNPNSEKSFTMILGANKAEDFDYGNKSEEYNHCAVEFTGEMANFYKVSKGTKTLLKSVYSGLNWNESNDLQYEIKEINDNTHFRIYLNGKAILSEVIQKHSYGRYIGFYSPKTNITVY